jgi:hypothetical protein
MCHKNLVKHFFVAVQQTARKQPLTAIAVFKPTIVVSAIYEHSTTQERPLTPFELEYLKLPKDPKVTLMPIEIPKHLFFP